MHELGHNFGSSHTHTGYTPVVDRCGSKCPTQLPLAKSATIMSYCDYCSGGQSNIEYTFGGIYSGVGPRNDKNSYSNTPLAGTVSNDARRVNAKMWRHVSSRTCTGIQVSMFTSYACFGIKLYSTLIFFDTFDPHLIC